MLTHAETHAVAGNAPGAASRDMRETCHCRPPARRCSRRGGGRSGCKAEAMEAPGFYLPACRHRLPRLMKAGGIKGVQGRVCVCVCGGGKKACAR